MSSMRRLRGWLLRLARRRVAAGLVGLGLLAPAIVLVVADLPWESWATDGLTLVLGGTGTALLLTALGGLRPDWIDEG